jgi:hypothetical protein
MFTRAVALTAALAMSACSFVFVRGPLAISYEGVPPPDCTESYAVPVIDTAITAIALAGVIYFATSVNENKELGMIVEGGIAAGFGISALRGRTKVKRCHRAMRESIGRGAL